MLQVSIDMSRTFFNVNLGWGIRTENTWEYASIYRKSDFTHRAVYEKGLLHMTQSLINLMDLRHRKKKL